MRRSREIAASCKALPAAGPKKPKHNNNPNKNKTTTTQHPHPPKKKTKKPQKYSHQNYMGSDLSLNSTPGQQTVGGWWVGGGMGVSDEVN